MRVLEGLQPEEVLYYFEEICRIPHISYHEQALSDYCVKFASDRGLFYQQDEMGNVLIIKEATAGYEDVAPVMIQGHLDMVGDKVPECPIDLEKEPIQIKVEGDNICAEGTTLGGDDGIAVAYALAILDAKDIPHPRLEVILTVSEEVGLLGANGMDLSLCQGRRLINIDSEEEGILTAGCAGGIRVQSQIPLQREAVKGIECKAAFEGLRGGHSGMEIDKGRANAIVLLGRFLQLLNEKMSCHLADLNGGVKDNVIPKDAGAVFFIAKEQLATLQEVLKVFQTQLKAEYGVTEPDGRLNLVVGEEKEARAISAASLEKVLTALNCMPNGVQAMSMDLPGLVETSLNMGTAVMTEEMLDLGFSVRSSVSSAKEQTVRKVELLTRTLGGSVEKAGEYPAWPYARNSEFRNLCVKVFKELYGREPKINVIHAGLECGILSSKIEGLDCISMGPDMIDIHSPKERLSISSVERVWNYLKALLAVK